MVRRSIHDSAANGTVPFAATLYPVTSAIGIYDVTARDTFFVNGDRPMAGTIHSDGDTLGSIKMLIDRRVVSNDAGGIGKESIIKHEELDGDSPLVFDFKLSLGATAGHMLPGQIIERPRQSVVFSA